MDDSERISLRKSFSEIVIGSSIYKLNGFNVYIKHRGLGDDLITDTFYVNELERLKKTGIFSEKEKLEYLIKNGLWDQKKEDQIRDTEIVIADLYKNKSKVFKFSDIDFFKNEIKNNEIFLRKILNERAELIGQSAEYLAKRTTDFLLIKNSFFRDLELKTKLYGDEEFESLSEEESGELFRIYNKFQNDLSDLNIQKIVLQGFFTEVFYLCSDNIFNFFNVAAAKLNYLQSKLLSYGSYFKNILAENVVPEDIKDSPLDIIDWYHGKKQIEHIIESNSDSEGRVTLPGVSKTEMSRYGIDSPAGDAQDKKLQEKLQGSQNRELSMEEMISAGLI